MDSEGESSVGKGGGRRGKGVRPFQHVWEVRREVLMQLNKNQLFSAYIGVLKYSFMSLKFITCLLSSFRF